MTHDSDFETEREVTVSSGSEEQNIFSENLIEEGEQEPALSHSEDIPAEAIAKEKEIATAQLAGKPENIIEKILVGKLNKWYTEVCVNKQPWLKDDKSCFEKVAPNAKIKRFIRWQVGEEI